MRPREQNPFLTSLSSRPLAASILDGQCPSLLFTVPLSPPPPKYTHVTPTFHVSPSCERCPGFCVLLRQALAITLTSFDCK